MEFIFGCSYHKPARRDARRIAAIARKRGAVFVEVNVDQGSAPGINGGRYQSWFAADNLGAPFDGMRAQRIADALTKAGLADTP